METALYILFVLFLIVVTVLVTWARLKNPDPERTQRISDDLFDIAMKIGKEKREGKDTSDKEKYFEFVKKHRYTGDGVHEWIDKL